MEIASRENRKSIDAELFEFFGFGAFGDVFEKKCRFSAAALTRNHAEFIDGEGGIDGHHVELREVINENRCAFFGVLDCRRAGIPFYT